MPPTSSTRPARSTLVALGGAAAMLLAACSSSTVTGPSGASAGSAVRVGNPPTLAITPADGSNGVHIDSGVTVVADRGSLDTVAVHSTADGPSSRMGTAANSSKT